MIDNMKFLRMSFCLFAILFFHVNTIIAQQSTKLQSLHHVDVFLIGASYNYEHAFGSNFTLSPSYSVIPGVYTYYIGGNQNSKWGHALYQSLSLDTRWYTNVNKRVKRGKSVENNSANFVSLLVEYIPEFSNMKYSTYAITPRWGFRSSFNQHFFMEFAIGLPYIIDRWPSNEWGSDKWRWRSEVGLHLGLKAGFGFGKK